MDEVLKHKSEYEQIALRYDTTYQDQVSAIEIVKKFIIDHNLIIYGGTALDYALRIHGDHIYSDATLEVPDLDFYSPDNIEHAYMLADILFLAGYTQVHARNAEHLRTMRVDLIDNHIMADISYQPREIFDRIPTITYNNMRVVAPMFQRIDQHNALSFPYDNPPREVVFARWKKDIERFNKSAHYYPLIMPPILKTVKLPSMTCPHDIRHYILTGDLAYCILYNEFLRLMNGTKYQNILAAEFKYDKKIIEYSGSAVEIMHFNIEQCAKDINATDIRFFEPLGGIIPRLIKCKYNDNNLVIYCSKNKLLSINSLQISGDHFRIVCVQYLLKHYLAAYYSTNDEIYLCKYVSITNMISALEKNKIPLLDSLFFLSTNTYGNENINLTKEIQLNRTYSEMGLVSQYKTPLNYYPARSKDRRHPQFDPLESEFFRERGLEITDKK